MPIQVVAEQRIIIGQETAIEGVAPQGSFAAVFEDDGQTGYCYALDRSFDKTPIRDALHVYNVRHVIDRRNPSVIKIGWAIDSNEVILLINDYPHAVFDFQTKQGFCRSGFPQRSQTASGRPAGTIGTKSQSRPLCEACERPLPRKFFLGSEWRLLAAREHSCCEAVGRAEREFWLSPCTRVAP